MQQTTTQQSNQEMPVKVLDTIKEKIKNNYDKLYDDYETNKKTILKSIQQTENNRAGEDALKSKFDCVIKEKQHYSKILLPEIFIPFILVWHFLIKKRYKVSCGLVNISISIEDMTSRN